MIFTSAAAKKTLELMGAVTNPTYLRVYVTGGGCNGLSYGFTFDATVNEDDLIVETDGVKMIVDPVSLQYLEDAEIDYLDGGLAGSHFVIRNPNVEKSKCGCGESFSA